ncbi:ATP-binding protein [Streptomyces angustmyceticus]|uniref:ATP-binding protein n=1 Tax=Streptomyces angustmyceticus TaxID=285578 RepID=UPI0038090654
MTGAERSNERGVSNQIHDGLFFHAVIQGRDITLQLPRAIQPALLGLPAKSPSFAGRDSQVREILHGLRPDRDSSQPTPTLLLSGLGGVGKTETAIQVAHQARIEPGWFPGGLLFIDLFGYDDERYLSSGIALTSLLHALGVHKEQIPDSTEDKSRLFRSILTAYAEGENRVLLVIDNASSAQQVEPLMPSDGTNLAIVTSRHTLNIKARIYELSGLDADSAVDVLRKVLRVALGEDENRVDSEISSAYHLAALCGYLPLALQICGAILVDTPRRPISSLADSLQKSQSLIDGLRREDHEIRSVFDLSYSRLSESEKQILGFASFSPGSDISTEAAARLIDRPAVDAEQMLISLSRAHLVEQGSAWGRWRLHDLVRHYALEKVEEFPGQESALIRLLDHYLEYSREGAALLGGSRQGELFTSRENALEWFDAEYQNLIACVQITAKQAELSGYAIEIPHRLARYMDARRLLDEWKEVMESSFRLLQGTEHEELKANALNSLGMVCRELYQIDSSIAFHREAVEVARSMGDRETLARYLNNFGNALSAARDFTGALEAHSGAATLFLDQGDTSGFARATDNSAIALREIGRPEDAVTLHQVAISKFREFGATESAARTLSHMGCTLQDLGRTDEAMAAHREAVAAFKELGLLNLVAHGLVNLSNSLRDGGDLDGALAASSEALELLASTEDAVGRARALNQLGLVRTDLGFIDQAICIFEESLRLLSDFEGLIDVGYALANLGRAHGIAERPSEALHYFEKAAKIFMEKNAATDFLSVQQIISVLSLAIVEDG